MCVWQAGWIHPTISLKSRPTTEESRRETQQERGRDRENNSPAKTVDRGLNGKRERSSTTRERVFNEAYCLDMFVFQGRKE